MGQGGSGPHSTKRVLWRLFLSGPLSGARIWEAMEVVVGLFLIQILICHHLGCFTKGERHSQAAQGVQIVVSFMGTPAAFGPPLNLKCKLTLWGGGPMQAEDGYTKQTNRVPTNCSSTHTALILAWLLCKK